MLLNGPNGLLISLVKGKRKITGHGLYSHASKIRPCALKKSFVTKISWPAKILYPIKVFKTFSFIYQNKTFTIYDFFKANETA